MAFGFVIRNAHSTCSYARSLTFKSHLQKTASKLCPGQTCTKNVSFHSNFKKWNGNTEELSWLASADHKDAFGIVVSYSVKVKLFLGALGGEVTAELPFILMHPKPETMKGKLLTADSQADIESFRQDTVDEPALLMAN